MQLPAPAVPRLVCEEQQVHGVAAAVKLSGPLLPAELAQAPPVGIDLREEERGPSHYFIFPQGQEVGLLGILLCVCFQLEGKGNPRPRFQLCANVPGPCVVLGIPAPAGQRVEQEVG